LAREGLTFLQRPLLIAAFLTCVFDPRLSRSSRDAVWGTALSAYCLDAGVALLDADGFSFHRFFNEAFGLCAHLFF
jgi:hypothetical protein